MNYYDQIKGLLISNEVYKKVKDYSKNKSDVETYYNITKINSNSVSSYTMPNFLNNNVDNVKNTLSLAGVKYEVIGDGTKVINQYPLSGTIVNGRVFIITNSNNIGIPNMVGYSRKDAINLAKILNIEYNLRALFSTNQR